jgi:hypothetical protein
MAHGVTPRGYLEEQLSSRTFGGCYGDARKRERVTRDYFDTKASVRGFIRRESDMLSGASSRGDDAEAARTQEERRRVRELFMMLDTDGSDTLDEGEVCELAKSLGKVLDDAGVRAAMAEMDRDGSGAVSFAEFSEWCEPCPAPPPPPAPSCGLCGTYLGRIANVAGGCAG